MRDDIAAIEGELWQFVHMFKVLHTVVDRDCEGAGPTEDNGNDNPEDWQNSDLKPA